MNLAGIERIFLDTAPLIYYVERNERYLEVVRPIFERIDQKLVIAFTSPITLAECLVLPCRKNRVELAQQFFERIVNARNTVYVPLEQFDWELRPRVDSGSMPAIPYMCLWNRESHAKRQNFGHTITFY